MFQVEVNFRLLVLVLFANSTKILYYIQSNILQKENIYAERQAPSATEILLQMYKRQQSEEEANTSRQTS